MTRLARVIRPPWPLARWMLLLAAAAVVVPPRGSAQQPAKAFRIGQLGPGSDDLILTRHGARLVDRILRGAKPADLPEAQPTNFEPIVDLGTAKALGITMPPAILARADQVAV